MFNFSDFLQYRDGALFWIAVPGKGKKIKVGGKAGSKSKSHGYIQIGVAGKTYLAHRVIWELCHGHTPEGSQVDHLDGDIDNNHIENLRLVSNTVNSLNRVKSPRNKSGVTGIYRDKSLNMWRVDFRHKYIGIFKDFGDACCARIVQEVSSRITTERHGT